MSLGDIELNTTANSRFVLGKEDPRALLVCACTEIAQLALTMLRNNNSSKSRSAGLQHQHHAVYPYLCWCRSCRRSRSKPPPCG